MYKFCTWHFIFIKIFSKQVRFFVFFVPCHSFSRIAAQLRQYPDRKQSIADTLSDILAGNTTLKRQTTPDTIETMQKIFRTTEIEKPANEDHLQTFEVSDEDDEPVEENAAAEVSQDASPDDADDLSVFKKRKKKCRGSVWKRSTNILNISTFRNACKSAAISQRIWSFNYNHQAYSI